MSRVASSLDVDAMVVVVWVVEIWPALASRPDAQSNHVSYLHVIMHEALQPQVLYQELGRFFQ